MNTDSLKPGSTLKNIADNMTTEKDSNLQKKNQEIIRKLRSGRQDVIIDTVKELRHIGNREVLPEVINLISARESDEVTDVCVSLLNDLKDEPSAGIISEAIRQNRMRNNLHRIVAACWQNGLDYSADIDLFIDLVIEEDYFTAIEAFTVVEQNIHALTMVEREKRAALIESHMKKVSNEKDGLVRELLLYLRLSRVLFVPTSTRLGQFRKIFHELCPLVYCRIFDSGITHGTHKFIDGLIIFGDHP